MKNKKTILVFIALLNLFSFQLLAQTLVVYDVVLSGGRIIDPETKLDKATFEEGLNFSEGIEYVMVNGSFVLRNGKTVNNVFPRQAVYGKFKK